MSTSYLLDTNFIYSLFSAKDILHAEAVEIFYSLQDERLVTSQIVIAELLASGEEVDFFVEIKTLGVEILDIKDEHLFAIRDLIAPVDRRKLKAADCLIISQTILSQAELITFDKKLLKMFEMVLNSIR
jgi:predicted nucleic acid-binding protein